MVIRRLFEPTVIGTMELRNRIVMPAMSTMFGSETGAVTERLINYYLERAKGGVGLIIVEATCVDSPVGKIAPVQLCVDHDKFISGLSYLAECIQSYGSKIALQLNHAGRRATVVATNGRQPVSASEISSAQIGVNARALTIKEIRDLVEAFAEGARRAKVAGFDAVEIHGAHGYLIGQFLSPYSNKRSDRYGGDLNGRMRFALEILRRTREKVDNFPIIFRLSGNDYVEGGHTLEDTKYIAKKLEEAGVDAVHISVGLMESKHWACPPMCLPPGCFTYLAEGVKKGVNMPVIAVGRINDPLLAEKIILEGQADLLAMGRALIADPELPEKAAEGRLDDIRKCIACNRGCIMRVGLNLSMSCAVNAAVGKEKRFKIRPVEKLKKVLVVGGGPAGMEAARVAALRGHEIILYEKDDRLGGQLILAAIPPYREEIESLTKYLIHQIEKMEVKIELNKEVTPKVVEDVGPDVVIIATGANPLVPEIPGVDKGGIVKAWDVLAGKAEVGQDIVVAGGGLVGCETAEFLAEKGKKVTIVEMLEDIAIDMEPRTKSFMLERFAEHQIRWLTHTRVEEITKEGIVVVDEKGKEKTLEADTIVLALGSIANRKLAKALKEKFYKFYMIGDCVKPRKILEAIHEGFYIGCRV